LDLGVLRKEGWVFDMGVSEQESWYKFYSFFGESLPTSFRPQPLNFHDTQILAWFTSDRYGRLSRRNLLCELFYCGF